MIATGKRQLEMANINIVLSIANALCCNISDIVNLNNAKIYNDRK